MWLLHFRCKLRQEGILPKKNKKQLVLGAKIEMITYYVLSLSDIYA